MLVANSTMSFHSSKNTAATHVTIFLNFRTFPTSWQKQPVSDLDQSLVYYHHVTFLLDLLLGCFTQLNIFDIHQSLFTLPNRKFHPSGHIGRFQTFFVEIVAMNCLDTYHFLPTQNSPNSPRKLVLPHSVHPMKMSNASLP